MKKALNLLFFLSIVCSFGLSTVFADQTHSAKAINVDASGTGKAIPEPTAVDNYVLAYKLAKYGKQQEDPFALLMAARIIKTTAVKEEKRTKTTDGTPCETGSAGKVASADELLTAAKQMAEGKGMALVVMIDREMQAGAERGTPAHLMPPILHEDRVKGEATDTYKITFKRSEIARVAVIGDGHANLDLLVYDENGKLIGKHVDPSATCLVEWTPLWTAPFEVKVKNLDKISSNYLLFTNQ